MPLVLVTTLQTSRLLKPHKTKQYGTNRRSPLHVLLYLDGMVKQSPDNETPQHPKQIWNTTPSPALTLTPATRPQRLAVTSPTSASRTPSASSPSSPPIHSSRDTFAGSTGRHWSVALPRWQRLCAVSPHVATETQENPPIMNKPQITPGLWHVGTNPGPIVYGQKGEQVTGWNALLDDEENRANCRAIAAVPDLLRALEKCHVFMRELQTGGYCIDCDHEKDVTQGALEKAGYTFP